MDKTIYIIFKLLFGFTLEVVQYTCSSVKDGCQNNIDPIFSARELKPVKY